MMNVAVPKATGGAGTGAAGGAAVAAGPPPIPETFAGKLDEAKQLHASHTARFAALRAAPPAKTRRTLIECTSTAGGVQFKVVEVVNTTPIVKLLEEWRGPIELTPVDDIFNDKLDFGVDSWAKLEALNAGMLPVMSKYKRFAHDNPDVVAETAAYVQNYRAIGDVLTAMEKRVAGDASVAAVVEEELKAVNDRIAAIAAAHGASFQAPWSRSLSMPVDVEEPEQAEADDPHVGGGGAAGGGGGFGGHAGATYGGGGDAAAAGGGGGYGGAAYGYGDAAYGYGDAAYGYGGRGAAAIGSAAIATTTTSSATTAGGGGYGGAAYGSGGRAGGGGGRGRRRAVDSE